MSAGSPSSCEPFAKACSAVAWAIALAHGGLPIPKRNWYSQAIPRSAPRGERRELAQQHPEPVPVAGIAGQRVGLAEVGEHLELDALPGVVLPHELRALEADALGACEQRSLRPPRRVGRDRQEERVQPRDRQRAARGHAREVGDHPAELALALAGQPGAGGERVLPGLQAGVVLLLRDRPGGEHAMQLGGDRRGLAARLAHPEGQHQKHDKCDEAHLPDATLATPGIRRVSPCPDASDRFWPSSSSRLPRR